MAWSNNIFYIAFISQIFILSYYFPKMLLARMQHVLASYPPEQYPKLYPRPIEHYKRAHRGFKTICVSVFLLGVLILFAVMFWVDHETFADHGFISVAWPAAYGMIQFIPLMIVEFSELGHMKQMRSANSTSTRTADLRRRGLTDLASPILIGMALLAYAGAILFDLYVHDFAVSWGHDTVQRAVTMTVTNGLLVIIGAWNLYGRKLNPHQSADDRIQIISVNLKSLLLISIALSAFIAVGAADDIVNLDAFEAVIMSVYFQVIAVFTIGYSLRNIKPDEIDFEVYKKDAAAV
jgi:hypothetical protein